MLSFLSGNVSLQMPIVMSKALSFSLCGYGQNSLATSQGQPRHRQSVQCPSFPSTEKKNIHKFHSLHDAGTVRADDMLPFQEIPKLQISKSSFFFFEQEIT
jgi:hypothetical protein